MSSHDYAPQVALELLMRKLAERDSELAAHVRAVVDQGRDVQEIEPPTRGRAKKSRLYRKTVPYPYDEALSVALNALAAYFIEQPLFVDSCLDNMRKTAVGAPKGFRYARKMLWPGYRIQKLRTVSPRSLSLRSPSRHSRARWRIQVGGRFFFPVIGFWTGTRRRSRLFGERLFDGQRFPTFGFTTSVPLMPRG
jgi:hypothetical protein